MPKSKTEVPGLVLVNETWGGCFRAEGTLFGWGTLHRFGVVGMRSSDARGGGGWFLEPIAKCKPQWLGFSKQDVGVLCFGYKEPGWGCGSALEGGI